MVILGSSDVFIINVLLFLIDQQKGLHHQSSNRRQLSCDWTVDSDVITEQLRFINKNPKLLQHRAQDGTWTKNQVAIRKSHTW
jgi:hypothetical protein